MGSLLFGFIVGIALLGVQYVLLTIPTIARAQILDDMLQIALEESALSRKPSLTAPLFRPPDRLQSINRISEA